MRSNTSLKRVMELKASVGAFSLLVVATLGSVALGAKLPRDGVGLDRLAPCSTIECIKEQMATAPESGKRIRIVDNRATARAVNPKFDELLSQARRIAIDRVLTDAASEEYFAQSADKLDQGIALDGESTRYTILDDGTEELLVVAGTQSDVRVMLGRRNPETGQFEISVHLVLDGQGRRVVSISDNITIVRKGANVAEAEEAILFGTGGVAGAGTVVPDVECFGFSDGKKIRIVCVCSTNSSDGFKAWVCFDSGWLD